MAPVEIPYLWFNRSRRVPAAYFRAQRGKITIRICDAAGKPLLPGQPGFMAAFEAIRDKHATLPISFTAVAVAPGSMAALIVAYRSSPEWSAHAPGTRGNYDKSLKHLRDKFGDYPVADLPRSFVFKLRDHFAVSAAGEPTPRRANAMVAVLRLLLAWAVDRGWRKDNPAINPGQLQTGPGFATWSPIDFRQFMACVEVGEPLKRAAALGYYTGQRKQDCLSALRSARADGGIAFIPAKTKRSTGAKLWIPESPELSAILDAAPAGTVTLLTRSDGQPWKEDHFNHAFATAVRTAGLPPGHGFHGLRKAMATNLASAGATDAEMDSLVYHADPKMTRHYRAGANQKTLALAGMAKLSKEKS